MLRWTTQVRTRWLIVAGVAFVFVVAYVAFVLGTAVDGVINVDARVHSTILTAFAIIAVSAVVLIGAAHLTLRLARAMVDEFGAAREQRECLDEKLDRIEGRLGSQALAAALKVPTGEFQRVNGTSHVPVPDVRPGAPGSEDELDDYAKGVVDGLAKRPGRPNGLIGLRMPRT